MKLLVEAFFLIFAIDGHLYQRWDDGLRVPVAETVHDCCKFFIRVDRSIACFFLFEWGIRIYCCFCWACQS